MKGPPGSRKYHALMVLAMVAIFAESNILSNFSSQVGRNTQLRGGVSSETNTQQTRNLHLQAQEQIVAEEATTSPQSNFTACLLVKDDNEILDEWIAYHYHALRLRRLVVAVDPLSKQSPDEGVFQKWRDMTDLDIDVWQDQDFMPDYFLAEGTAPKYLWRRLKPENRPNQTEAIAIVNHRYRQRVFFSQCMKDTRKRGGSWLVHIDTDEYVVPSQQLRQEHPDVVPSAEKSGSVLSILEETVRERADEANYPCISMPRTLFNAIESTPEEQSSAGVPAEFDINKFETLRWNYHAPSSSKVSGRPKVILDVSAFRDEDFPDEMVHSIHKPINKFCNHKTLSSSADARHYPVAANHYLGSWERYNSRDDTRRSREKYDQKAAEASAERVRDDTMRPWLQGFVKSMGKEVASNLLQSTSAH